MAVFQESSLFQELFERIVEECMSAGLVEGEQMSVDGSFIMANASHHSRIPTRTVQGGSARELWGAEVPGRTRAGERQWHANASARQSVDR